MNLPPDKARLLRQYDNEKKWELICDQERFQVKNPPHTYIQKLKGYLDPAVTRKKFRRRVQESTQVLRELEISLRTNHIGWVREFLNEENKGLDVLVEYLSFAQYAVTQTSGFLSFSSFISTNISCLSCGKLLHPHPVGGWIFLCFSFHFQRFLCLMRNGIFFFFCRYNTLPSRRTLKNSRLVSKKDDVHVCIMCLRAIMNYQYGFNMVMSHPHAVNEIALSLNNKNPRTKALVLELLAAVCLVRGGHEIILAAFDNFKEVCGEKQRFEKLMEHFRNEDNNIDFMVSGIFQKIPIFSILFLPCWPCCLRQVLVLGLVAKIPKSGGLRSKLKHTESDKLQVQIQAYLDNVFDVGALLEDAETKNAALERVEELEENLSHLSEKLQDTENEAMAKIVELEKQLMQRNKELDVIREIYKDANSQVHTLRKMVKEKEEAIQRQSTLERKIHELEKQGTIKIQKKGDGDISILPVALGSGMVPAAAEAVPGTCATPGAAPSVPLPPPPPPLPALPGSPEAGEEGGGPGLGMGWALQPPWAVPGPQHLPMGKFLLFLGADPWKKHKFFSIPIVSALCCSTSAIVPVLSPAVKIKKPIKTKFRMPVFNWVALKPNQINGTVFNEIDDERILEDLNVDEFEEIFKTKAQGPAMDLTSSKQKIPQKGSNKVTLLDANRAKNLAITLRKAGKTADEICRAIHLCLDPSLLQGNIPSSHSLDPCQRDTHALSHGVDENQEGFFSGCECLDVDFPPGWMCINQSSPCISLQQLHAIIAASVSIKSSQKLKKILEIILALGNYMNSSKRGAVYGFKLQSLDLDAQFWSHPSLCVPPVSLENVLLDVKELQRGLELTKREFSMHDHNTLLKDFIQSNEGKLKKLQDDAKIAQDAFDDAVKYFGENPKTTPPSVFFPVFVRFVKAYKQAEEENELRKKQEQALMEKLMEQEALMEQQDQK
ncbi:FMNL2 protein, partial [Erithacus rubecula]|nr:FMNL2 protein [Erithacus rubecula]